MKNEEGDSERRARKYFRPAAANFPLNGKHFLMRRARPRDDYVSSAAVGRDCKTNLRRGFTHGAYGVR